MNVANFGWVEMERPQTLNPSTLRQAQDEAKLRTGPKPKSPMYLTHRERQLIARLRQLRRDGKLRAEVEIEGDGPKVKEGGG